MQDSPFLLPIAVVSPMDIARLVRELKNLEEYFTQNLIRNGETPAIPRYSRLLDAIVVINKVDLVDEAQRKALLERFVSMQDTSPIMHISFSVDPPGAYVQKIVAWLRENIHPLVLVRVGLQPNIGAGCIVRTTNKTFDFSLRQYFDTKHDYFVQKLHDVVAENSTEAQQPTKAVDVPAPEQPSVIPEAAAAAEPVVSAPVSAAEQPEGESIPVEVRS